MVEIERSVRVDVQLIKGANSTAPACLSDMRLDTPSIAVIKQGLERVAKTFTDTTCYDISKAWRGAYVWVRGRGRCLRG